MNKFLIVALFGLLVSFNLYAQSTTCCSLKNAPLAEQEKAGCKPSDIAACKRLGEDVPEDRECTVCTGQTINEKGATLDSSGKTIVPAKETKQE